MFDGGEQLQQVIGRATRSSSATLPLLFVPPSNFHHHHVPNNSFPCFDPPHQHFSYPTKLHPNSNIAAASTLLPINMDASPPWSTHELLALFKLRSTFPQFTWEHLSRKMAELGYKRSADNCKEKFELESRCFNNNANSNASCADNNYRIFTELDQLCHGDDQDHHHHIPPAVANNKLTEKPFTADRDNNIMGQDLEQDTQNNGGSTADALASNDDDNKIEGIKRKRMEEEDKELGRGEKKKKKKMKKKKEKFKMLKGLCEEMVKKLMGQQEEMHKKLIQDMVRRDEEKVKRDEDWKKQEMDRMKKELDSRAKEQEIAGDRQTTLLNLLSKLAASIDGPASTSTTSSSSSSSLAVAQNPITQQLDQKVDEHKKDSQLIIPNTNYPTSISSNNYILSDHHNPQQQNPNAAVDEGGKRWPREEVLALINIRCKLSNSSIINDDEKKQDLNASRAPLWERISQGMSELGYKRNAKRCKEKWENINKYFRKTKDSSKKRSVDSRTCPYFHHLNTLYNQPKLVSSLQPEIHSDHHQPQPHLPQPPAAFD